MSKYNILVNGISVEAVWNKLGGDSGAQRFLSDEVVVVEKSLFQQLQRMSLPPLDNSMLYMEMGMKDQYVKALAGKKMPTQDPNLWDLLVLPDVTCNMVMAKFQELGLKTSGWCKDWDANLDPEYEGHKTQNPYLLGFARSLTGESTGESANDRWKKFQEGNQGYNDPILCDGLLLMLGVYLATGKRELLSIVNWTRTRSRFRSGDVVGFDANLGEVRVSGDYPDYASPDARVRPEVSA